MDSYKVGTPAGTRDRLFAECVERRRLRLALTSLFESRGYGEVITPEVEYYDLFVRAREPLPQEDLLKLVDKSGKLLVMRPDCTAPIARVAASRLRDRAVPQRLFYDQTIYRARSGLSGTEAEIAQCGVELIGAAGLRGDIEVVSLAIDALLASGIDDFRVELGHIGYFTGLTRALGLTEAETERLRGCIESKNFAQFGDLLPAGHTELGRLPYLFGGVEVLDEAAALTDDRDALAAVADLRAIYEELARAGRGKYLSFDLGLVQRLDYYSGLIFKGYAEGAGNVVLAGGRYDGLIADFGRDLPATGFAIYVDSLADCLPKPVVQNKDTIIYYTCGCLDAALRLLDTCARGTAELSAEESEAACIAVAREKRAARVLCVSKDGVREVKLDAEA